MGYNVMNLLNNGNVKELDHKGCMFAIEHTKDMSVTPGGAQQAYFESQMGVRRRQVLCQLGNGASVITQAGGMQWTLGNINCTTGVKGAGDLVGKMFKGAATGESAVKPEYSGSGLLMLEPTYKHILLIDLADWGGHVVLDDGLFHACEGTVKLGVERRHNLSSAVLGGMGLFNIKATGSGILAAECPYPKEELVEITLDNDVLKVDGNFVAAWSGSLSFSTERSGKTLLGSAGSGEGLVNVYRGTGKVWMMPTGGA